MKSYALGIDIGGTAIKLGLFQTDGTLLEKWQIPTRTKDNGRYVLTDALSSILGRTDPQEHLLERGGRGRHAGCRLLFLPHFPELNPIEKSWAWLRRFLRKILPSAASFDDTLCSAFQLW